MSNTTLVIIGVISILVPAVLFFLQMRGVWHYNAVLRDTLKLGTACAGSEKPNTPKEIEVVKLDKDKIVDENGSKLNWNEYRAFIVCGESMLLGGIQDKDLVLVKPKIKEDLSLSEIVFPSILIINRDEFSKNSAEWLNDHAEKKVRRSWKLCDLSSQDVVKMMKSCMDIPEYQELCRKFNEKFPSSDELVADFKVRVEQYKRNYPSCEKEGDKFSLTVISTTLDTQKQRVHFSIHPAHLVEGEVCYSFHISKTQVA